MRLIPQCSKTHYYLGGYWVTNRILLSKGSEIDDDLVRREEAIVIHGVYGEADPEQGLTKAIMLEDGIYVFVAQSQSWPPTRGQSIINLPVIFRKPKGKNLDASDCEASQDDDTSVATNSSIVTNPFLEETTPRASKFPAGFHDPSLSVPPSTQPSHRQGPVQTINTPQTRYGRLAPELVDLQQTYMTNLYQLNESLKGTNQTDTLTWTVRMYEGSARLLTNALAAAGAPQLRSELPGKLQDYSRSIGPASRHEIPAPSQTQTYSAPPPLWACGTQWTGHTQNQWPISYGVQPSHQGNHPPRELNQFGPQTRRQQGRYCLRQVAAFQNESFQRGESFQGAGLFPLRGSTKRGSSPQRGRGEPPRGRGGPPRGRGGPPQGGRGGSPQGGRGGSPQKGGSQKQRHRNKRPSIQGSNTQLPNTQLADTQFSDLKHSRKQFPETKMCDTDPSTRLPETQLADTERSKTELPDSQLPPTRTSDAEHLDTKLPDTQPPNTQLANTEQSSSHPPGIQIPSVHISDREHPGMELSDTERPDLYRPNPRDPYPRRSRSQ